MLCGIKILYLWVECFCKNVKKIVKYLVVYFKVGIVYYLGLKSYL